MDIYIDKFRYEKEIANIKRLLLWFVEEYGYKIHGDKNYLSMYIYKSDSWFGNGRPFSRKFYKDHLIGLIPNIKKKYLYIFDTGIFDAARIEFTIR